MTSRCGVSGVICLDCKQSAAHPHWGGYSMRCVHCCARLIRSARPLKHAQEALLAAITMRPENPSKEAVLLALKALDVNLARPKKPFSPVSGVSP